MNYSFIDFLKLIGSLGMFLYGMTLMSEALQKVAGRGLRDILARMTSNRFYGLLTGFVITAIIQSSSATTVMVVSFVNAGLMDLAGAVSVILGANVGTTATAWIVSVLGFTVNISGIALIMFGFALPLLFSKIRVRKSWGEFIVGFALLFIGLQFLQDSMPNIDDSPALFSFIEPLSQYGFGSYLIFLFIGTVITLIIQSSSASMALTIVFCAQGWIGFDMACAMVLGENIGTTITAILAASVANRQAKRAAMAHLLINIFGVVWMLCIFKWFVHGIASLSETLHIGNPYTDGLSATPMALALFQTCCKGANALMLIWFVPLIVKAVRHIIPIREQKEDIFVLKFIKYGILSTPEASIYQAQREITNYGQNVYEMFQTMKSLRSCSAKEFTDIFNKVAKMEDHSDNVEVEIADYLTKVAESKLSTENSQRLRAMYTIVSEIESVADSIYNIARAYSRKNDLKAVFSDEQVLNLDRMLSLVEEALLVMCDNLQKDYRDVNPKKANECESAINIYRTELQQDHLMSVEQKGYNYLTGVVYSDLFFECERVGDYIINVTEAIKEVRFD